MTRWLGVLALGTALLCTDAPASAQAWTGSVRAQPQTPNPDRVPGYALTALGAAGTLAGLVLWVSAYFTEHPALCLFTTPCGHPARDEQVGAGVLVGVGILGLISGIAVLTSAPRHRTPSATNASASIVPITDGLVLTVMGTL